MGKARAVVATMAGVLAARGVLRRAGIELVLGLGGYASLPAVLAAWTLGVPTLLHEANAVAGVANRLAGRVADGVLLAFETAASDFASAGALTGVPVREEIVRLADAPRELARRRCAARARRRWIGWIAVPRRTGPGSPRTCLRRGACA